MPIRVTPTQAAAMQRRAHMTAAERAVDREAPAKPGRAKRHPILADAPPEPTRLLSVAIEPPRVPGGTWTVVAEYTNGHTTRGAESEEVAKKWKAEIETYWKER